MIIAIGGIRVGTGKVTIAVNLAVELAIADKDALLQMTKEPQQTLQYLEINKEKT